MDFLLFFPVFKAGIRYEVLAVGLNRLFATSQDPNTISHRPSDTILHSRLSGVSGRG